ncbi:hypothetical protein [Acinetobacter bereziniae]|uniref:beta family protein n=1 Tax=Acinetobacter bereziniae TaxID=106648 RepID=UPI0005754449|nr:hypothetical protein [Acinetobacter bereziniae]CEI54775.1 hypothetical protein [Acinetobacter bereziniae]
MNSLHSYYPILPAKRGEFKAYKNLTNHIRNHIMPIFELPVGDSDISTLNFVNKKLNSLTKFILSTENHNLAIDTYYYSINNQILENGRHIYEYIYSELRQSKLNVIPIIGYDRWYNSIDPTYKNTISVIDFSEAPYFIIRLDGEALDHLDEPDFFKEQIDNILNGLKIESINCLFLIDFKSIAKKSLPTILEKAYQAVEVLEEIENLGISISGCSIPETINQAIDTPDTSGLFLRKENLVWKSLKKDFSNINLKYSDYGVKAPSGKESIPAGNNANGKIRYS